MESAKTNEQELTSTMGSLLSNTKEEKSDANSDSTPTSSTDAFTTTSTSQIAADDPISSTSSDVLDSKRTEKMNDVLPGCAPNPLITSLKSVSIDHTSSIISEKDLLDMNITDTSTEKITENVDDIVQDLENLLGEPTTTFDFTIRTKDTKRSTTLTKELPMDLDDFSVEFQMPEEETPTEMKTEQGPATQIGNCENSTMKIEKDKVVENLEEDPTSVEEDSPKQVEATLASEQANEEIESSENQCPGLYHSNSNEPKPNLELVPERCDNIECVVSTKDKEPVEEKEEEEKHLAEEQSFNLDVSSTNFKESEILEVGQNQSESLPSEQHTESEEPILTDSYNENAINEELPSLPTVLTEKTVVEDEKVQEKLEIVTECEETNEVDNAETQQSATIEVTKESVSVVEEKDVTCNEEEINKSSPDEEQEQQIPVMDIDECQHVDDGDGLTLTEPVVQSENIIGDAPIEERILSEHMVDVPPSDANDLDRLIEVKINNDNEIIVPEPPTDQTVDAAEEEVGGEIAVNEEPILNSEVSVENQMTDHQNTVLSVIDDICEPKDVDNKESECVLEADDTEKNDQTLSVEEKSDETILTDNTFFQTQPLMIEESHQGEEEIVKTQEDESTDILEELDLKEGHDLIEDLPKVSQQITDSDVLEGQVETQEMTEEDISINISIEGATVSHLFDDIAATSVPQEDLGKIAKDVTEDSLPSPLKDNGDIYNTLEGVVDPLSNYTTAEMEESPSSNVKQLDEVNENNIQPDQEEEEEEEAEDLGKIAKDVVEDSLPSPLKDNGDIYNTLEGVVDPLSNYNTAEMDDEEVPSSSSNIIENNILPLMEDVPDLDMLNAISTLGDNNKSEDLIMPEDDCNLASSEEQPNEDVPFESCMDTTLPTVDEIFAEPGDQQTTVVELPDDNLETLLAVASLQDPTYDTADLTPFTSEEGVVMKIPEDKLFEEKDLMEPIEEESTVQNQEDKLKEPLVISVDDSGDKEKVYSPRITIKLIKSPPVDDSSCATTPNDSNKGSLKMTITKQSDTMHSILKIYDPADDHHQETPPTIEPTTVPKLIIKPIVEQQPQSPKIRSNKQVFSPSSSQRSSSPRITIKPIVKPVTEVAEPVMKITIKPVLKPEKHSPKFTIKPIVKPEEELVHSPRVTIKPVVKPSSEDGGGEQQAPSPRITIKPIVESSCSTPRVTIKPVLKPQDSEVLSSSPKITIKPIVKPQTETESEDFEDSIKERIVLKINKGTIPTSSSKEQRKRDTSCQDEEKSEKTPKIKLKFSKEGGHPHIVQNETSPKRSVEQSDHDRKRQRIEAATEFLPGVTITPIGGCGHHQAPPHSKLKEMLSKTTMERITMHVEHDDDDDDDDDDDVTIVEDPLACSKSSPIVISEESNQDNNAVDPMSEIPVFEITPDSVKTLNPQPVVVVEAPPVLPAPRKRGRPRKVPLQVREDFKDPKEEEPKPVVVVESTRPKRSCRGQSVRTTLGIKPRKPRGPGRGRGGKRGMGTRSTPTPTPPPETQTAPSMKPAKEPKLSAATKLKQHPLKEDLLLLNDKSEVVNKQIEIDDGFNKSPSILAPPTITDNNSTTDRADIVMYEEETRMSAETGSSRAQTPAKVVSSIPSVDLVEESQSSVQSTATTESVKVRKGPRLEVHQEPEGAVISADQLAEYYWMGGGPFMLQEQVAQFLGIKSFKRKYPNIARRVVDMQERDFIRESGLAGEAMCDLGLTAVNSSDILDIMYSDFQDKYEEYCKHQRDRQAKDLTNKQKALSLAASQEKTKMDITQQAVQSAATWNANFNKARRDQRKACMDLQTLTVHFPKGKMKQINKPKIGSYPVALVPGQFTDYYKEFTPTEINNLPLNTMCYDTITRSAGDMECDSQTDGSGSESDSTTSDSDSSYSGSSDAEDCTICHKAPPKRVCGSAVNA